MTEIQKYEILRLREKNVSFTAIAEQMGISRNTIKSFCRRREQTLSMESDFNRCTQCGNPLIQIPHTKTKRFCNKKCRVTYWNNNRTAINAVCAYCGKGFYNRGIKSRKYCSVKCYTTARWGEVNSDK